MNHNNEDHGHSKSMGELPQGRGRVPKEMNFQKIFKVDDQFLYQKISTQIFLHIEAIFDFNNESFAGNFSRWKVMVT